MTPMQRSYARSALEDSLADRRLTDVPRGPRLNSLAMFHLRAGDVEQALELWREGESIGDLMCTMHLKAHAYHDEGDMA